MKRKSVLKNNLDWYLHHCWRAQRRGTKHFFRSKETVSESSSSSACIPSISYTASWIRIRRKIPTVISQQQKGCYIVRSHVMLRPVHKLCELWVLGYPLPLSMPRFCLVLTGWNIEQAPVFMSPQAYRQSLAPCNVFQSIKNRKGAFPPCAACLFYNSSYCKNLSILYL